MTGYAELDDSASWWSEEDSDTPTDFHMLCQAFVAALGLGPCILLLDGINDLSAASTLTQQEVGEALYLFDCGIHMSGSKWGLMLVIFADLKNEIGSVLLCLLFLLFFLTEQLKACDNFFLTKQTKVLVFGLVFH